MASRRETLLSDNDVLENRQLFERNPRLPQLEALLRVMMEELPTYELLSVGAQVYSRRFRLWCLHVVYPCRPTVGFIPHFCRNTLQQTATEATSRKTAQ